MISLFGMKKKTSFIYIFIYYVHIEYIYLIVFHSYKYVGYVFISLSYNGHRVFGERPRKRSVMGMEEGFPLVLELKTVVYDQKRTKT